MKVKMKTIFAAMAAGFVSLSQVEAQDLNTAIKELDANRTCAAKENFDKLNATGTADGSFAYGYYLLRTRQPDLAKAAFEKGLAADPKNQLNKVGIGAALLAKGDRMAAKMNIDEALKNTKNRDVNVLFRAAEAYSGYVMIDSLKPIYKATDPAEALRLCELAVPIMLKNKAEIADLYMAKGDAFFTKGESGAAVSAYEDAIRVNANNGKAIAKIAKIYWGGRNYQLAQDNFKKAIETEPDYAPANRQYAELLFAVRQYKPAARYYNAYLEKLGTCIDEEDILRSAQFDFIAEDNAKVLAKLEKLKNSKNNVLLRMEGWSAYKDNQYDRANQRLTEFLTVAPEKAIMNDYKFLGNAIMRGTTPDTTRAMVNLEKAAEMDTVDNGYKELASMFQSAKKYKISRDYWIKAIAREPKYTSTDLYSYALAQYQYANSVKVVGTGADSAALRGERRTAFLKADELFGKYIERKADFLPVYNNRARANYYAYTPQEAMDNGACVPHMEKFIQLAEVDGKDKNAANLIFCYQVLATYSLAKLKDDAKAKAYFDKIIEVGEANGKEKNKGALTSAYQYYASYYRETVKDEAKVKEYFTKIIEIDPENAAAKQYLTPTPATPAKAGKPAASAKPVPKKKK